MRRSGHDVLLVSGPAAGAHARLLQSLLEAGRLLPVVLQRGHHPAQLVSSSLLVSPTCCHGTFS